MTKKKHPLASVGVNTEPEIALLMPDKYMDCRFPILDFSTLEVGQEGVIEGFINSEPTLRWPRNKRVKQPLFIFKLEGLNGQLEFVIFGDCKKLIEDTVGKGKVYFHGTVSSFNGQLQLQDAVWVKQAHVGRVIPFYPGTRGAMKAERVTNYLHSRFQKVVADSATMIRDRFGLSGRPDTDILAYADTPVQSIEALLRMTHSPECPYEAQHATTVWQTLSAFYVAKELDRTSSVAAGEAFRIDIDPSTLDEALKAVPFTLVDDQESSVRTIAESLGEPQRTHHLINGDVGSGKTITFLVIAAAAAIKGARVAIMAPNGPLAKQIYQELNTLWPEISKQFVNGETRKGTPIDKQIVVGTQALCHRLGPEDGINLVIVDEQQRYSVEQREGFMSSSGNLIESTATCIPRTMALLQFGSIGISKIESKHSDKHITTRLLGPDDNRMVFGQVKAFLDRGDRVLVVYPLKEGRELEEGEEFDKAAITESFEVWDRKFPGQAHMLHGDMAESEKTEILDDLRSKKRQLLISTTVVEVGINIPDLFYCVVVDPERAGLVTLHQIRGRLVRNGGDGLFDMFCMNKISKKTENRLNVLVNSNDGFEIAEEDLKLRGAGDLKKGSEAQSGKSNGLLLNQPINTEYVRFFLELLKEDADRCA